MLKIQYVLYPSLILILVTFFISVALSQNDTIDSNLNSSIIRAGKINNSTNMTVIDIVGDIDCSNNLPAQVEKDNPTLFIAL
jgi:hypothetical protein